VSCVIGLELTQEDFRRIRFYPKPVFIGTAGQLIMLPAIASGLAWVFHPPPFIVAGMVLVSACPGGAISNYYVYLARACHGTGRTHDVPVISRAAGADSSGNVSLTSCRCC
jgi:predicted Na+-dependent transporter